MRTVTFTEFRKNASEMLDLVERGETLCISRHGKTVARLVRDQDGQHEPSWKRPVERIKIRGKSLSQTIIDERNESP